jgi:hypothetical protein
MKIRPANIFCIKIVRQALRREEGLLQILDAGAPKKIIKVCQDNDKFRM